MGGRYSYSSGAVFSSLNSVPCIFYRALHLVGTSLCFSKRQFLLTVLNAVLICLCLKYLTSSTCWCGSFQRGAHHPPHCPKKLTPPWFEADEDHFEKYGAPCSPSTRLMRAPGLQVLSHSFQICNVCSAFPRSLRVNSRVDSPLKPLVRSLANQRKLRNSKDCGHSGFPLTLPFHG